MQNSNKSDYLKYWRVIRYFVKAKYGLSTVELDMLLFLYSEDIFSRKRFDEFEQLMPWNKLSFDKLMDKGWIEFFRKKSKRKKPMYQLSYKCQRVLGSIYKKLNGEEIPTTQKNNPIFKRNIKYTDKAYKKMILEMNQFIKQQRRLSLESQ